MKKAVGLLLVFVLFLSILTGCGSFPRAPGGSAGLIGAEATPEVTQADIVTSAFSSEAPTPSGTAEIPVTAAAPAEDGVYTSKEDVALYIHLYGKLPSNFITKKQAEALGWSGGSLENYAPGKCIGGSYFGNYEGLLPAKDGRTYTECDIDTLGASGRGAKRIVFSNDGLVYYTDDHYESFTLLYGDDSA